MLGRQRGVLLVHTADFEQLGGGLGQRARLLAQIQAHQIQAEGLGVEADGLQAGSSDRPQTKLLQAALGFAKVAHKLRGVVVAGARLLAQQRPQLVAQTHAKLPVGLALKPLGQGQALGVILQGQPQLVGDGDPFVAEG